MTRIIIADDHSIIRDGLKSLLGDVKDVMVTGEAANGMEVLALLQSSLADIVIMDINMPVMNGIETTKRIKKEFPEVKIITLSMYNQSDTIKTMVEEGVWGYLLKDSGKAELLEAINSVMQGRKYFNNEIFELLLMNPENSKPSASDENILTTREKEILKLIAEEYASKEIADKLFLSINTVNAHRRNLIQKLGTKNTAALVRYAVKNGIIKLDE
jgi:DNA-binding NarL/FixJ family response regulator